MEVSRYCLDTSAYSHFRRGDPAIVRIVTRARWIGVSTIVLGELRHGFMCGNRGKENEARLRKFLGHPLVKVLDVDDEISRNCALLTSRLKREGKPIPTNDAWIAATSISCSAAVLTYDKHFEELPGVVAEVL